MCSRFRRADSMLRVVPKNHHGTGRSRKNGSNDRCLARDRCLKKFRGSIREMLRVRFPNRLSDHRLAHHAAAIHLVFEIDYRRPGKMPGQARTRGPAAHQFAGHDRVEVMHGIGLHRGGVLPAEPECTKAAFHRSDREPDFFLQAVRAEVAVAHDALGIAPAAFPQFGAAGDDE